MKFEIEGLPPEPKRRLTEGEYNFCIERWPRLCFDALVMKEKKILLIKRAHEPYQGCWSLPGGKIGYKETIKEAAERILLAELGLKPTIMHAVGNCEFLDDGPVMHSVSMVYFVVLEKGEIRPTEHTRGFDFFEKLPKDAHPVHAAWLWEQKLFTV